MKKGLAACIDGRTKPEKRRISTYYECSAEIEARVPDVVVYVERAMMMHVVRTKSKSLATLEAR